MSDYTSTENIPDDIVGVKARMLNRISMQHMNIPVDDIEAIDRFLKGNMDIFDDALSEAYGEGKRVSEE